MLTIAYASLAFQAPMLSARAPSSSSVRMGFQAETTADIKADSGVSAPFGFFDPVGFSTGEPILQENNVDAYNYIKEVELKHGRVAMLAALGFVVGEHFHPLFGGNIDVPSAFAFQQTPLQIFWPVVIFAIGGFESITSVPAFDVPVDRPWTLKNEHVPGGTLGFLGGNNFAASDPSGFKKMQTKELNNGRLAMMAIAGMVTQELVTGTKLF
mmetsp:Transcript_8037/g.19576  ORF Transcript_8037/g.19576 Transcript_8037/m.19576 type:complete len:212 (-) Transcript_8037:306-941(-)